MNDLSKNELTAILCFYYYDYKKNSNYSVNKFLDLFKKNFNKTLSEQILTYNCSLFKNVDSSFHSTPIINDDSRYYNLWNYYVSEDRINRLKSFYIDFKIEKFKSNLILLNDNQASTLLENNINDCIFTFIGDFPKDLYIQKKTSTTAFPRDLNVSYNALKLANFKCEYSPNHETFIRKKSDTNYTEGHHLIPLNYQDTFNVNLDVEANIVSLCSNCHNHLHYGKDIKPILYKLYNERKDRLEKCGIKITFELLLEMYE